MSGDRQGRDRRVLVLGLGNPLSGDDAFGLEVVALLERDPDVASVADVATAGADLLAWLDVFPRYDRVLLMDLVLDPERAGAVRCLEESELDAWTHDSPSAHAMSPLLAWRLFRRLYPDCPTRLSLVVYVAAKVQPGVRTYEYRHLAAAVRIVHEVVGSARGPGRTV